MNLNLKQLPWRPLGDYASRIGRLLLAVAFVYAVAFVHGGIWTTTQLYHEILSNGREWSHWMMLTSVRLRSAAARIPHLRYNVEVVDSESLTPDMIQFFIDEGIITEADLRPDKEVNNSKSKRKK